MKHISNLRINRKKAIVFDLDGTLINTTLFWRKIEQKAILYCSGQSVPLENLAADFTSFVELHPSGDVYTNYRRFICSKYKLGVGYQDFLEAYDKAALRESDDVKFKESAVEVLYTFKRLGYKLALATASTTKELNFYTRAPNIKEHLSFSYFDHVLTKDDVVSSKPHPEVYQKILARYGIDADQCLVFEDSLRGIKAAKDAGIEVIHVFDEASEQHTSAIREIADYQIDSFEELLSHTFSIKEE